MHPSAVGRTFRTPICPKGHDKRVVGVCGTSCVRCAVEYQREKRSEGHRPKLTKVYCVNGHNKLEVGVRPSTNACAECCRQAVRRGEHSKRAALYGVPLAMVGRDADALKVREVREALGLTREQLSRLSGVHYKTLSGIEDGRQRGWPQTRKKIVDALASVIAERRRRRERAGI
ncbi:MAG: helix-turn-helix transcriptional regulator [Actinomycetota bacterium]|nr:helix-turn-helix transcriptional regulator [Actinomycetota bacterium]